MIGAFTIVWLKILCVVVIMAAMIGILLSLRNLFHHDPEEGKEETARLREEVRTKRDVISKRSLFHKFLTQEKR